MTASSPPPNSREAEAAAQRAKESGQRIEEEIAEEPDFEMLRRSAAAVDLAKGDRAVAERELKEGCPKADAEELSDALSELEAFSPAATGSVKEGGEELEELLEDICPL